jgi:hypothetical protein
MRMWFQGPTLPDLDDQDAVEAYLEARHVIDIIHDYQPGALPIPEVRPLSRKSFLMVRSELQVLLEGLSRGRLLRVGH